jgi:uncharacterized membrane protein YqaE (UPF0057 family)
MKMKNLLSFLLVFLAGQLFFSCSSKEYFRFSGTNPEAHNKVKAQVAPAPVAAVTPAAAPVVAVAPTPAVAPVPVLEARVAAVAPAARKNKLAPALAAAPPAVQPAAPVVTGQELAQAREKIASLSKAERKALKRELRQVIANGQAADDNTILLIILAILLPPLAVGLKEGIGSRFWISLLLTILFFLPGVIYALLVVTDTI